MVKSVAESVDTEELESLMREFPDWKQDFPDIARDINPPRHHKHNRGDLQDSDERVIHRRSGGIPVTDYQARFDRKYTRPRSTKRPPTEPRDPFPPPMDFSTNQRTEFTAKEIGERVRPIIKADQYVPSGGKFDGKTMYMKAFHGNYELPISQNARGPEDMYRKPAGKFDDTTTNREHFQKWAPVRSLKFTELPSFTGSILYPEKSTHLETTTQSTFQGKQGPRAELIKLTESHELKRDGPMDMNTTTRMTFKGYEDGLPAPTRTFKPRLRIARKQPFTSKSQSQKDFPGYEHGQPLPPKPVSPAPDTIDLKFDNKVRIQTEQRQEFMGIDALKHPPPKLLKKESNTYERPTVKFEALSNTHNDYRPIDIQAEYSPPVHAPSKRNSADLPKFDATTSNNEFFKKWDVKPRPVYGDFHEGHGYMPPVEPFTAKSTNQETYYGKFAPIPDSFRPPEKPIDQQGAQDFATTHRLTFKSPTTVEKLSKMQRKMLYQNLKRRRQMEHRFETKSFDQSASGQPIETC